MSATKRRKEVLDILQAIGFPLGPEREFHSPLRQKRVAHILLGVANIRPNQPLSEAFYVGDGNEYAPKTRDLIQFINKHYGENLSMGSYDDIRRKNLDFLVAAGLVVNSANSPGAATNDGTRGYAISADGVQLFKNFKTQEWNKCLQTWAKTNGGLTQKLAREKNIKLVRVQLPDGAKVSLSEGKHNDLQKAIIEDFLPRFLEEPELLYLGDTTSKFLVHHEKRLSQIGLASFSHETLPDIVAVDRKRKWIYFIEAVHSANPITPLRHLALEELCSECEMGIVYVSAFADRAAFRKWVAQLSWETEAWLASDPSHMIHFNGDRFLGPH